MLLFTVASSTGSKEVVIDLSNKTLGALLLKDWQGRTTSEMHFKNFETITLDGQTALVPKEIEMVLYKRNADGSNSEQQLVIAYYERVFNQSSRSFRFSTPKKAKVVNLNNASALPWMLKPFGRTVNQEETKRPEPLILWRKVVNVLSNLRFFEILCGKFPVDQVIDHGCDIVRATVLVVKIIGVFPYINGKNRFLATG